MHTTADRIDVEDVPHQDSASGQPTIPSPPQDRGDFADDVDPSTVDNGCASSDSLSLFRSYSMPLHTSSAASDDDCPLHQPENPNEDEDDEDYDELLTTPTSQLQLTGSSRYSSYQSAGQRMLSCSLPPSLARRRGSPFGHENPLHELLQLTQPMREGVISREKLLPSSRMKQVGVGGRGRRGLSSQRSGSPSAGPPPQSESASSPQHKLDHALWSPSSDSSPLFPTHISLTSNSNPILAFQQLPNPTPLVRPTPIAAWQKPHNLS